MLDENATHLRPEHIESSGFVVDVAEEDADAVGAEVGVGRGVEQMPVALLQVGVLVVPAQRRSFLFIVRSCLQAQLAPE